VVTARGASEGRHVRGLGAVARRQRETTAREGSARGCHCGDTEPSTSTESHPKLAAARVVSGRRRGQSPSPLLITLTQSSPNPHSILSQVSPAASHAHRPPPGLASPSSPTLVSARQSPRLGQNLADHDRAVAMSELRGHGMADRGESSAPNTHLILTQHSPNHLILT